MSPDSINSHGCTNVRIENAELERLVAQRTKELSDQLHFLQQLIEAIPGPVYYKDANLRFLGCNKAFEKLRGVTSQELVGKTAYDISSKDLADIYTESDRKLLTSAGSLIYENQVRDTNGAILDVMFHKATFTQSDGQIGGLVGVMLDITERKRMESNLLQAATVFECITQGVAIASPDGTIVAINPAFTGITGYSEEEVIGKNPRMLQSGRHDKAFYQQMWSTVSQTGRWHGEVWNRRKNGDCYPEWLSLMAVKDQNGKLTNYVATFTDITLQKETEEKIQTLAFTDPLTGLPNRRLLLDRLQHGLSSCLRNHRYSALLFLDLDDFKNWSFVESTVIFQAIAKFSLPQ